MSNITPIEAAIERRARRHHGALAEMAAMHPSLRWMAGDDGGRAHRRDESGRPACGAVGILVLADVDVPLCGDCYPRAG